MLEAKLNIFMKLIGPGLEREVRIQIEKEVENESNIFQVYQEVLSSLKVKKILNLKGSFIDSLNESELDSKKKLEKSTSSKSLQIGYSENNKIQNKNSFISFINQECLFSFNKFFSLESEIYLNIIQIQNHLEKNLTTEFYSILNYVNSKQKNKIKEKKILKVSHTPNFSNFSKISHAKENTINNNHLYPLPEIKQKEILNTKFVIKKTLEYRYYGNLSKKINIEDCKKKYKLRPIKYNLNLEDNLKLVNEIFEKKQTEEKRIEQPITTVNFMVDTTSNYYLKFNRSILAQKTYMKDPFNLVNRECLYLKDLNKKPEEIPLQNKKKRILSTKYKINPIDII